MLLFNIQRAQPLSAAPQIGNILVHKINLIIQINSMKKISNCTAASARMHTFCYHISGELLHVSDCMFVYKKESVE